MMKKLVTMLLVLVMVVGLIGCAKTEEKATSTSTESKETQTKNDEEKAEEVVETIAEEIEEDGLEGKVLGFINAGPDDYYAQFGDAFKAIAGSYGMEVIEVNSEYSPEKELSNVQDMIAKEVDAIAVITSSAAGAGASVAAAQDAGMPIFFIAGKPVLEDGVELTGHVTDNFVMIGYMVGQWVAENYPDAKTVQIPGFLGQGPAEGEMIGFDMALEEAGMAPSKILASGEWQRTLAIPIIQDLVASGEEFDVLFAANEEMAFGAMQVFDELGVEGKVIVSCNGKEDGWLTLEDGSLAATGMNPPSLNADLCIQQIVRHLNGEKFEKYLEIKPPFVLTADNIDKAIPWNIDDYLAKRANNDFMWNLEDYEASYVYNKSQFAEFNMAVEEYMANN